MFLYCRKFLTIAFCNSSRNSGCGGLAAAAAEQDEEEDDDEEGDPFEEEP